MNATELRRRKILLATTTGVGGLGLAATATPFLESFAPSEAARAAGAPVDVNVAQIAPGTIITVEWRGKPIWVVHRTKQMLDTLPKIDNMLADPKSTESEQPDYAKNEYRSVKPEYLVLIGICTHLGCIPTFRPQPGAPDLGADWPGGFYCPCHGSKFDLAGRVFKNVPAPINLEVPPYEFLSDSRMVVGADKKSG